MQNDDIKKAIKEAMIEYNKANPRLTKNDITEAIENGIKNAFTMAGLDISDDEARVRAQQDHHFLRRMRRLHEAVGRYVAIGIIGILASVIIYLSGIIWKE